MRLVDAMAEENRHMKEKFGDKSNLIDRNTKIDIKVLAKIPVAFK